MINYTKEDWSDVKNTLEALFLDWDIDMYGNLVIHWKDIPILNEKTLEEVDFIEHLWLTFEFTGTSSYNLKFGRTDRNILRPQYIHPHVRSTGDGCCTGNHPQGASLCRDIVYFNTYVKRYNRGSAYQEVAPEDLTVRDSGYTVNTSELQKHLDFDFYFDYSTGQMEITNVRYIDDSKDEDFVKFSSTETLFPLVYYWKGEAYPTKWKNQLNQTVKLDLAKYVNRDTIIKSVSDTQYYSRIAGMYPAVSQ